MTPLSSMNLKTGQKLKIKLKKILQKCNYDWLMLAIDFKKTKYIPFSFNSIRTIITNRNRWRNYYSISIPYKIPRNRELEFQVIKKLRSILVKFKQQL